MHGETEEGELRFPVVWLWEEAWECRGVRVEGEFVPDEIDENDGAKCHKENSGGDYEQRQAENK